MQCLLAASRELETKLAAEARKHQPRFASREMACAYVRGVRAARLRKARSHRSDAPETPDAPVLAERSVSGYPSCLGREQVVTTQAPQHQQEKQFLLLTVRVNLFPGDWENIQGRFQELVLEEVLICFGEAGSMLLDGQGGSTSNYSDGIASRGRLRLQTGNDLRVAIAEQVGVDARLMRLFASNTSTSVPIPPSAALKAILENLGIGMTKELLVEVKRKRRGGKKPGRGWFKGPNLFTRAAGHVVGDLAFLANVQQYYTHVLDGHRFDALVACFKQLAQDSVIMCAGSAGALQHRLLAEGGTLEGNCSIRFGGHRMILVSEIDQFKDSSMKVGEEKADESAECKQVEPRPNEMPSLKPSCSSRYTVDIPQEASHAGVVFVYDAHVQQVFSLAQVVSFLRCHLSKLLVFHLVSDLRSMLIQTEADRIAVMSHREPKSFLLGQKGFCFKGLPRSIRNCISSMELPGVVEFSYSFPETQMRLVQRLQNRFGCIVTEVPYGALCITIEAAGDRSLAKKQ